MAYVEYNICYLVDQKVIKFKPRVEVFEFQKTICTKQKKIASRFGRELDTQMITDIVQSSGPQTSGSL